jgi:hypothetical protein
MTMVFITALFNAPGTVLDICSFFSCFHSLHAMTQHAFVINLLVFTLVKSLIDSMVMSNLKDRSRYGRMRLYGQLGFGVGSSACGILLSRSTHRPYTPPIGEGISMREHLDEVWQSITGYKLLFFTYLLLSVPTFICIRAFDRWTKDPTHNDANGDKKDDNKNKQTKAKPDDKKLKGNPPKVENEDKPTVWDGIGVLLHSSDALLFFFLVLVVRKFRSIWCHCFDVNVPQEFSSF